MPKITTRKGMNRSTEDYVKGIYHLQSGRANVPTSVLANHLKVRDGSVTGMLKKLSQEHLINYARYKGVNLTPTGKKLALTLLRRHRLWEMFLVKFLSYTWDEVHDEAEKFEHVISNELERRLDRALGYPKVDPHGDPIPSKEGRLQIQSAETLGKCSAGDRVEIVRVSDRDPGVLQHAAKLGLSLNKKITVEENRIFDGSMVVTVGKRKQFISALVASSIFVQFV